MSRQFISILSAVVVTFVLYTHSLATFSCAADTPNPSARPNTSPAKPDESKPPLIYVPYRSLQTILNDPQSTAIVPLQEYLRLRELSRSAGPRLAAVVTESHYVAKVEKDVVRIQAALLVHAVDKGCSEVTLNFGNAAIGKIDSENNRVLARGVGRGAYSLLLPAAGAYKIDLELSTQVRNSPDGRSFELDCPPVAITTLELTIPETDYAIEVSPPAPIAADEASQRPRNEKASTRFKVNLSATPRITARWHPRVTTRPQMQLLAGVENVLRITVGDGAVRAAAILNYKVFRGELGQLRVAVPSGDRILDVSSPQGPLRSWRTVNEPNRQLVIVDLLANATKEVTVEVHTERPLPSNGFDVAGLDEKGRALGIHAIDVVRESGELIVSHREGIDISVESERGLVRVDATELPPLDRRSDAIFYKFYSPAVRLQLEARPVEPQIAVVNRSQIVLTEDELRLTAHLRYDVTRTGIFELAAQFPDGLTIDSVESSVMKAYHSDPATHKLTVTLNEKQQGSFDVVVKGHRELGAATTVDLPLIEPARVFREDGFIEAFAPEGIELTSDEAKLTGAHPVASGTSAPPQNAPPNAHRAGAWSYHQRPVAIRVKTVRKPTRLTARIATSVTVQQELAAVVAHADFSVENAGIDTFRIAVPEAVADKMQIQSESDDVGIKQQSRDETTVDGWVGWTLVLQRKVTGRHRFLIKYDVKPSSPGASPAPGAAGRPEPAEPSNEAKIRDTKIQEPAKAEFELSLPQPLPLKNGDGTDRVPLVRIEGEAAVLKDRALAVTASASGGDVEPIDVRELKQIPADAYLAYRYEKQPVQLKLTSVKYGVQEVVETVVSRALVEAVIARDATALYRCRYLLKTSQRQRLAIDLPGGAILLGIFLDGKSIQPETRGAAAKSDEWSSYFVNLVRSKPSDEAVLLAVQFRQPVSAFESMGGRLKMALPRIGGTAGDRIVVQQLRAAAWVPPKYSLVETPKGFRAETQTVQSADNMGAGVAGPAPSELENWIGGSRDELFEFPLEGNGYVYSRLGPADSITVTWVNMPVYTLVISLAITIIAWLLRRSRWETVATLVLTVALIAVLMALIDSELVWHILLAARYGLVALVAIWLIEAFRRTLQHPKPIHSLIAPTPAAAETVIPSNPDAPSRKEG